MRSPSGTPVHFPIALHPSTQSCLVICVLAGNSLIAASEKTVGLDTKPSMVTCQSAKLFRSMVSYSCVRGSVLPLAGKTADRSASVYSFASALVGVIARCARSVSFSAIPRIEGNHPLCVRLSQPARAIRLAAPRLPFRNCLRSMAFSGFMMNSLMSNDEPSSDHRANVIEKPSQDHLTHMDHDKANERKARDKVNRSCGLPPAQDRQ